MGRDIVAAAKDFEEHAKHGYLPDVLARELHSMSPEDRLAVAKQIDWDMKHQTDATLPKIDFYDSGDLKSVETTGKSGSMNWSKHVELDKNQSNTSAEVYTTSEDNGNNHSSTVELTEKDARGHLTHSYRSSTDLHGVDLTVTISDDNWSYDATTGKQVTHDRSTSWGEKVHEEYDAATGNEKFADITNSRGSIHRTYDASTGKLRQEDIDNADKTHETVKYNSNGDKLSREKQYGDHGDKGTREWVYSPRTGKEVYTEWRSPDGKVTKNNIDDDGHWHEITE